MKEINTDRLIYKKTKAGLIPEDWKLKNVGSACRIRNELRFPLSSEVRKTIQGEYPYFGPTGVLDYIDHFRVDGKYVLIAEDGDHFLKFETKSMTLLVSGKFNVNNHAHIVEGTDICISEWFYQYFMHQNLNAYITRQGAGRYKLNKDSLERIPIPIPLVKEQKKITEILFIWDTAIDQTRRLIEAKKKRKKGFVQRFLIERKYFGGFVREKWKLMSVGKLIFPATRPVPKPSEPYLAIGIRSHGKGTFHRIIEEPDKIAMETLYRIEPDDLILNITFAWEGAVAIANEKDRGGLVSHRFPTYKAKENADLSFLRQLILTKRFVWELGLISPGGAGRNRVLNKNDFLKIKVFVPSKVIQQKIGKMLASVDKGIELLEKKLIALENQKRGLMQKLLTGEVRVKT